MTDTAVHATTRRRILLGSAAVVAAGAVGGRLWLAGDPPTPEPTIADALATLDRLQSASQVTTTGAWSAYRVFNHLAQSVELSMTGYPEHKPALFKRTAGKTAFAVFRRRGQMHHGLDEPIPGADRIADDGPLDHAFERLRAALVAFDRHAGALAPHFAYGALTRQQYAVAHAMHLNNHLVEIVCEPSL